MASTTHICTHCNGFGTVDMQINRRAGHGRALALIRRRSNMTQKQIARELLVEPTTVSTYERGVLFSPDLDVLRAYAVLARRVGLDSIADVLEAT